MSIITNLGMLFFLWVGCQSKEQLDHKYQTPVSEHVIREGIIAKEQDSIRVFKVSLEENFQNETEKIATLIKQLQSEFVEYPFKSTAEELKEYQEDYKGKGFLKILARDFKNENFNDVSSIHYSYLVPSNNIKSGYITLEEWYFKDKQKAKSCFESLKKYEEAIIHFKTINWIWVYQENKIFLVFALDHQVVEKEMQYIKQEIINVIKPLGTYDTVQFYECTEEIIFRDLILE